MEKSSLRPRASLRKLTEAVAQEKMEVTSEEIAMEKKKAAVGQKGLTRRKGVRRAHSQRHIQQAAEGKIPISISPIAKPASRNSTGAITKALQNF